RAHIHGLDIGADALSLKLLARRGDVGDLEGDMVDPDRLLAADPVNLEHRLVVAGKLKLDGIAVMLGPQALLETERAEERHIFLEAVHDQLDVVDLGDGHLRGLLRYALKLEVTVW